MNKVLSIKYIKIGIIACLLYTAYSILYTAPAGAQAPFRTMSIVPPSVQTTLKPGSTTEGVMKVVNDSPEAITFTTEPRDFIVVDSIGTPNFLPLNTLNKKYSASSWIAVHPATFTLAPKERIELNYYIQVPLDAKPGGHYAGAVFTAGGETGQDTGDTSVTTQIGTLFYITVDGPVKELASVTKFFSNAFQEYGPVKILTQVGNMGELHIRPTGTVKVSGWFGKTQTLTLPEYNIFPEAVRDLEVEAGQKWMFGRYSAELMASYGKANNMPLTATLVFWVFPWRLAVIIILIIVAIVLGVTLYKRRKDHHNPPQDSNTNVTS
jgi:hypothetical protein